MQLHFIKANPTENMTIFVLDPLPREYHLPVARELMAYGNLYGEQVGFLEQPQTERGREEACARLQMMGGEFCGNAARALAASLVFREHPGVIWEGATSRVFLEVSGLEDVLECTVERTGGNILDSRTWMPPPERVELKTLPLAAGPVEVYLAQLPGILHLLVPASAVTPGEEGFWQLKEALGLDPVAMGVMFYDPADYSMVPLVYVRDTKTLVWERGCGSGALALGAALAWQRGSRVELALKQPGGRIGVGVDYGQGQFSTAWIRGPVQVVAEGTVYVNI